MSELTLLVLRLAFLLALWSFVFAVVYALRSDLFGGITRVMKQSRDAAPTAPQHPQSSPSPAPLAAVATAPARPLPSPGAARPHGASAQLPTQLVITSGPKQGSVIALSGETLTIGRSAESSLVIRDEYTSTHHARLFIRGDVWHIQDLASTNGTFLDSVRVREAVPLAPGSSVSIGTTSFELRQAR